MSKRPKHRRLYIILAIIAVILVALILTTNQILSNLMKKELTGLLNKDPNSLYDIRFEDIRVNLFRSSVNVLNVTVSPTDSSYAVLHEGKVNKLVHLRLPEFRIMNIHILKFLRAKTIDIGEVDLTGFSVDYLINRNAPQPENKKSLALHSIFSEKFQGASIGKVKLNAKTLRFFHVDQQDSSFIEIDSVRVTIQGVALTPETTERPIPLDFKDIRISTGHFSLSSMKYYSIATTDVYLDVVESTLVVDGFRLIPRYSKEEYNKAISYNNDWFSISTKTIRVAHLDFEELEFNKLIDIKSLSIEGADIDIYRDKRLPDAPFKYKPLLAGLIGRIPIEMNIDTVRIEGTRLRYQEQTDASDQPGTVFFEPLKVTVQHVTNSPDLLAQDPTMVVDFHGRIMGTSDLDARLNIDLTSKHEDFTIRGSLQPVPGTAFNLMVEHLLPVKIESADISRTAFSFTANDDISHGELILEYDNLQVEVLKGRDQDKKSRLISFVANGLIHDKNIPDHHKYRTGTIRFERRKDKAIVNFLWNSCKTGIISIVAPIADKNKKVERQETREEKKEERKEERERGRS